MQPLSACASDYPHGIIALKKFEKHDLFESLCSFVGSTSVVSCGRIIHLGLTALVCKMVSYNVGVVTTIAMTLFFSSGT